MAPGTAKGKSKPSAGDAAGHNAQTPPLQAIVIVDAFTTSLESLHSITPRCLLPLANTPVLEYTLDMLARNDVHDVILYAAGGGSAHADAVEAYLTSPKSIWSKDFPVNPFHSLTILKMPTATSASDCMRDLDSRDLVSGDFLVVSGDVVSNIDLRPALQQHRERRAKDKNAIMTMVLTQDTMYPSPSAQRERAARVGAKEAVFVIDPTQDRCLLYEEIRHGRAGQRITLDPEILTAHATVDVRSDLLDAYIDIATPDVLALWSENFDYTTPRASFLFGVLKDYELNGKTIHTHIVASDAYARRVDSLRNFSVVSGDVLAHRTYPLGPACNFLADQSYRAIKGGKVLAEQDRIEVARGVDLVGRCVIGGKGTVIQRGASITNSIIGRSCRIGKDVQIKDAVLLDDVEVRDGATVTGPAILASGAFVDITARVMPGAVVATGSCVDAGKDYTGALAGQTSKTATGEGGGYDDSEDEDDLDAGTTVLPPTSDQLGRRLSQVSFSNLSASSDGEHELDDDDTGGAAGLGHRRTSSARSDNFSNGTIDDEIAAKNKDFEVEATASILDGLTKGDAGETIFLELNSYRMSVDASQHYVRKAMAAAFVSRIRNLTSSSKPTVGVRQAVHDLLSSYQALLSRIILDKNPAGREDAPRPDQVDFLLLLQRECITITTSPSSKHRRQTSDSSVSQQATGTEPPVAVPIATAQQILLFTAKELYDLEVVEEEGVLQWWADSRSSKGTGMQEVRRLVQQFVTFLEEAEEDDEDDSDDEDEGDEE